MKIIEDLYYGNIDPHTRRAQPDTALSKLRLLLIQNENKMRAMLTEEQNKLFEEYVNDQLEVSIIADCAFFIDGFKLGAKIMLDVLTDSKIKDI